jgi:hypothetical protein
MFERRARPRDGNNHDADNGLQLGYYHDGRGYDRGAASDRALVDDSGRAPHTSC